MRKRRKHEEDEGDDDSDGGGIIAAKKANPNVHSTKRSKGDSGEVHGGIASNKSMANMGREAQSDATRTHEIDDPDAPGMSAGSKAFRGPMRAPTNIRTTMRIDYQPDLCKDYKDTGYCGYGDACKFMHDRGDYLSGWQLEKQWEAQQNERKKRFMEGASADGSEDGAEDECRPCKKEEDLPWGCFICRGPFVDAVATKCKHYFCESCALGRYNTEKQKGCFVCMLPTMGIFNVMKELRAREKTERALAKEIAARMGVEWPVSTGFLLGKAEKTIGEPEGNTTLSKLEWIQSQLQGSQPASKRSLAEEEAEEGAAQESAQAALDTRAGAWKEARQGYVFGGSGLDAKYSSGL